MPSKQPTKWPILFAMCPLLACVPKFDPSINNGPTAGASSNNASLSVMIPGAGQLSATDGSQPVTGARLLIAPVLTNCLNATMIDVAFSSSVAGYKQYLTPGCDYNVSLSLGPLNTNSSVPSLTDAYYSTSTPNRVTSVMIQGGPITLQPTLVLTPSGQKLGLPVNPSNSPSTNPLPQNIPPVPGSIPPSPPIPPTPLPNTPPNTPPTPPQPTPGLPGLSSSLAGVNVSQSSGSVPLSNIFTNQYLVVDFSRPGCGPCVELAQESQSDSSFKASFSGSAKCNFLTVIPPGQLQDWYSAIGGASNIIGSNSYEYSGSHSGFANLIGYNLTGTPSLVIIDRTGKILDDGVGMDPPKMASLCQH